MCDPLENVCRSSNLLSQKQAINFDDINDVGMKDLLGEHKYDPTKGIEKIWYEPVGLAVNWHNIMNYRMVITIVLWLFMFSIIIPAFLTNNNMRAPSSRLDIGSMPTREFRLDIFHAGLVDGLWCLFILYVMLKVKRPCGRGDVKSPRWSIGKDIFDKIWFACCGVIGLGIFAVFLDGDREHGGHWARPCL